MNTIFRKSNGLLGFLLLVLLPFLTGCENSKSVMQNPVPALTTISPTSAAAGGAALTLTVNGSSFVASSVVNWNGSSRPTTFVSASQLTAGITAADIAAAGTVPVTVTSPVPGGGSSSPATFTITAANNPSPTLSSLSPTSITAGASAFTLTVNGTNFINASTVNWNGTSRTTTFVSATQITAAITAADIAASGTAQITVTNPAPGGGTSLASAFDINAATNPVPTITNISPTSASAGSGALTLTVNGSNFISSSLIQWNGTAQPTAFINGTQLTAQISAANLTTAGNVSVTVKNPVPGGGTSNAATFTTNAAGQTVGVVETITLSTSNGGPNGQASSAAISTDGQFIAFGDSATNLTTTDTNGNMIDIFQQETCRGASAPNPCTPATQIVSLTNSSTQGASGESVPEYSRFMSGDGRFVVFTGVSQDFISNPPFGNNSGVIVLRDTCKGQPSSCTPSSSIVGLNDQNTAIGALNYGVISGNGRTVTFVAAAANVVTGVPGGNFEIYARDTCFGALVSPACTPKTILVSQSTSGSPAGANSIGLGTSEASISDDGRYVAFASDAKNLVPNDTQNGANVFLRDTCIGAPSGCTPQTTLVSANPSGAVGTTTSNGSYLPSISGNGRFIMFQSDATDLVSGKSSNAKFQIYLRDMCTGAASGCTPQTTMLSLDSNGNALNANTTLPGTSLVSSTGRYVVFGAGAPLRAGDYVGEVFSMDTCAGVASACTPSVKGVSFDSQGHVVSSVVPVVISGDGHFAILLAEPFELYLALTGY